MLLLFCVAIEDTNQALCAAVVYFGMSEFRAYSWRWRCEAGVPVTNPCGGGQCEEGIPCEEAWPGISCFYNKVVAIELRDVGISGPIPVDFFKLTSLTYLDLSGNSITGTISSSVGEIWPLRYLNLARNPMISGTLPSSIGQLSLLSHLYLSHNQMTGSLPATLDGLTSLEYLSIWKTSIGGTLPTALGSLTTLKHIQLSRNKFSGTFPKSLGQLTNLVVLDLSQNDMFGQIPSEILDLHIVVRADQNVYEF